MKEEIKEGRKWGGKLRKHTNNLYCAEINTWITVHYR